MDLVWGSKLLQPPIIQNGDAVGQLQRLVLVMGVEGGTKSGHPTAADQGPQRLILGVTRVTVRVSLLVVFALPGLQPLAAAVA